MWRGKEFQMKGCAVELKVSDLQMFPQLRSGKAQN